VLEKGGKVLVQVGYMHSFTRYRLYKTAPRFGYILNQRYGDRVFQVCLHQMHFGPEVVTGGRPKSRPVIMGFMEKLLNKNGNKAVGFDIDGSPFANLRDRKSMYFALQEDMVFSDIAQGYIFLKPIRKLGRMTWVKGFVDESNFERVRAIAKKRRWIEIAEKRGFIKSGECDTPEGLDKLMKLLVELP
jgi:hypothetical protein